MELRWLILDIDQGDKVLQYRVIEVSEGEKTWSDWMDVPEVVSEKGGLQFT